MLLASTSLSQDIHYWASRTPEGHARALSIAPFMESADNIPLDQLEKWCVDNGWTKDKKQAVIVRVGSWHSLQAKGLYADSNGQVTKEGIAYQIRKGFPNWQRVGNWWLGYLVKLREIGYDINVGLDIEGTFPTRSWKYVSWEEPRQTAALAEYGTETCWAQTRTADVPELFMMADSGFKAYAKSATVPTWEITAKEVVTYLYSNDRWTRNLPRLTLDVFLEDNVYGVRRCEQAMLRWNHFIINSVAKRLDRVFAQTTYMLFPNASVGNYGWAKAKGAPLISAKHAHPLVSCKVGSGNFVAYMHDARYKTNRDALAALDMLLVSGQRPTDLSVWIAAPWRTDAPWHASQAQYDELIRELTKRGIQTIWVF